MLRLAIALIAVVFVACFSKALGAENTWATDAGVAVLKAAENGKPVLILVRNVQDLGSLDAGHWLTEDAALKELAGHFECARVWNGDASLKNPPDAPQTGLLFLTPKGETIRVESIPVFREKMGELLKRVLANPISVNALLASVTAEMAKGSAQPDIDTANFKDAIKILRGVGRADDALPIQRVLAGINLLNKADADPEVAAETDELEIHALANVVSRLANSAEHFAKFQKAEKAEDRPTPRELKEALEFAGKMVGADEAGKKAVADAVAAFAAFEKDPASADTLKAARERVGALAAPFMGMADQGKPKMAELDKKFYAAHPHALRTEFHEYGKLLQKMGKDEEAEKKIRAMLAAFLVRSMKTDEFAEVAGYLMYPIIMLQLRDERVQLAERVQKELPVGRHAADVYLDQADLYFSEGNDADAAKLWALAKKATENGESPSLNRAARNMAALIDPKTTPNASRWGEREVLNIVVLAPDFDAYAKAIALWTDKTFFPVLFQDDLYAPRFVAAFKSAEVLIMPSNDDPERKKLPELAALRHTILSSWTSENDDTKGKLPAQPSDDDLRARLEKIGAKPLGVVFGDGESGEMAGALALAAGRFQGLELLARPTVGNEGHIGSEEHYLSNKGAWTLAGLVQDGLRRWGLPRDDNWAYVTLAGKYPYRYFGEQTRWGTTYATEDLLGRDEDSTRIAVCGRLMGDNARSSYQAMCSLFLQPESAFLFNTYGGSPKTEWGHYQMDPAEKLLTGRLKVTHFHDEGANLDTFRAHEIPWNRDGLVCINSSGYPVLWSVARGDGTTEDFPIGVPSVINIVHSGSAAELYDTETIAHRAVWGGAFWYFGSSAEPLLDAFQPLSYVAPRITRGVPLVAAFRQRTAQNRFYPWRLLLVGDPQYGLRDKPAERKALTEAFRKAILPQGAAPVPRLAVLDGAKPADWGARLRYLRLTDQKKEISELLGIPTAVAELDGTAAANAIEEYIKLDRCPDALKLWNAISDEARKNYAARVYARYAAGHEMDLALVAKDFKSLAAAFNVLLTTSPAQNYVERLNGRAAELAKELKADADYSAWLADAVANPRLAGFRTYFQSALLNHKEKWTDEDKAQALNSFVDLVKNQNDVGALQAAFKTFSESYISKIAAATPAQLTAEVKALFKADTPELARAADAMRPYEIAQMLAKDWLILGPFKDQDIGAWEKVGPHDGKTAPDFTATFKDGADLAWTRPFKPQDVGIIDLLPLMKPNTNVYAYAAINVIAEKDADAVLMVGSDDGVTAWLDGKEIHRNPKNRGVTIDDDKVAIKLTAGTHSLVLRIDQGGGGWGFCARIADKTGNAVPGVTMKCPKE
jgi:hypothetical protein